MTEARREIRDQAERTLVREFAKRDRRRSKKPTNAHKGAAVDLGRVDLWTWLSRALDPTANEPREPAAPAVAASHALAEHLEKVVLPELLELAPGEGLKSDEKLKK